MKLPLRFRPYSDFISITGMKASGKTIRTKHFCKSLDKFIVIDPNWQLGEIGYVVHFPERILEAFRKYGRVIYQPKHMGKASYEVAFNTCLTLANYTLVVDEVQKFARRNFYICNAFQEIVNRGRAQGIGLIVNTRRPAMIHRDIRSNSDHVICFVLQEEDDRKYMGKWINVDPQKIKELPEFHSFYYDVKRKKTSLHLPLF